MRNCGRDEGGPVGFGNQVLIGRSAPCRDLDTTSSRRDVMVSVRSATCLKHAINADRITLQLTDVARAKELASHFGV
jgi:hypothetical protein